MRRCCVEAHYDLDFATRQFEEMIGTIPDDKLRDAAPVAFRQALVYHLARREIDQRNPFQRIRAWLERRAK